MLLIGTNDVAAALGGLADRNATLDAAAAAGVAADVVAVADWLRGRSAGAPVLVVALPPGGDGRAFCPKCYPEERFRVIRAAGLRKAYLARDIYLAICICAALRRQRARTPRTARDVVRRRGMAEGAGSRRGALSAPLPASR